MLSGLPSRLFDARFPVKACDDFGPKVGVCGARLKFNRRAGRFGFKFRLLRRNLVGFQMCYQKLFACLCAN